MDPNVVANTIIDPNQQGRGFIFNNGESPGCIVSGLTVTNGYNDYDYGGGGFHISASSPTIKNCVITGNWSWSSGKSPRGGGGIHLFSSNAAIINCTISQNTVTDIGGGIYCYKANPTIRDCSITGNEAVNGGGGIYCLQSNPKIINCFISRNKSPWLGFGGGINCRFYSSPEIVNCSITDNYASIQGGGIRSSLFSNPTITNSILWGNTVTSPQPGFGGPEISLSRSTLTVSYSDVRNGQQWAYIGPDSVLNWGNGNIDARPNLTLDGHLQSDSPCIDVGDPCYSPTPPATDIDEEQRIYAGSVDMGADEFIDTDGDRLPDFWENKYFGSPVATGPNSKSDADPDTDGHTNLEEYQLYSSDPKVAAKTYYVDALEGCDGHDGLSWRGAKRTIQAAIDETTNPGDRVIIAEGLYTGTGNYNLDPDGRAIVIQSTAPNDPNIVAATIIDPDQQGCGFDLRNGEPAGCRISGLTITNGAGWRDGGGFSLSSASPTISNCFISRNISYHDSRLMGGTGINCYLSSNPIIKNCVISGNTASYCGGAIGCLIYCSPIITNCTITGNRAYLGGGGISSIYSNPTITNCILWENSSPDGNEIYSENSQIDITYSDIQGGWAGQGNINLDPCFIVPGYWDGLLWVDGDYHLPPSSPCINAGDPYHIAEPNETDLDGQPRIFLGRVDIGADEFVPSLEVPMHFTPRTLNPKSKGKWIKAHLVLPEGFSVEDINTNSPARIVEPFTADSVYMDVFLNEDGLVKIMAAFDRAVFCSNGSAQGNVVVIGRLTNGQYFYGTDTIRIKTNNLEYLAVLTSYWLAADCGEPDWCAGADLNRDSVVDFIDFALFDGCCLEFIKN